MIRRVISFGLVASVAAAGVAGFVHLVRSAGRRVPGGMLIANPAQYNAWSHRLFLGSLFGPIAADIARAATPGARILEVGSGPGHLAGRLAREHGLDVTGVDLDPAMVDLARANAARTANAARPTASVKPEFVVADAAALPFPDSSFDLVVSTLSMHHWATPATGLAEIRRVLRPAGRALIWDFRSGRMPLHRHAPDPLASVHRGGLDVVSVTSWRWPWRLSLLARLELKPSGEGTESHAAVPERGDRSSHAAARSWVSD